MQLMLYLLRGGVHIVLPNPASFWRDLSLLQPIGYGRSDAMLLLGLDQKHTASTPLFALGTQQPCCKEAQIIHAERTVEGNLYGEN